MLVDLLAEIERQGGYESGVGPEPVVSLESFFQGNDDPASIGANLSAHPGVRQFHTTLLALRDRPDVDDVRVGISEVMGNDEWPFSDHVYVVTSASAADILRCVATLRPEPQAGSDWWNGVPPAVTIPIPPGRKLITLWWD